jgi:GT2 family glycosyltransferase
MTSRGTIAICTRGQLRSETVMSLFEMIQRNIGLVAGFKISTGSILPAQRNDCIHRMTGDWLLFVDDDMEFAPDALPALLETQRETGAAVTSGLYLDRRPPHLPILGGRDFGTREFDYSFRGILDVDLVGCGFMLVTRECLEALAATDPDPAQRDVRTHRFFAWPDDLRAEDVSFCDRVRALGMRIVVDTRVSIGHVAVVSVNRDMAPIAPGVAVPLLSR